MKYLLFVCSDGNITREESEEMEARIGTWLEHNTASGARKYGHALQSPETAKTVRSRGGETLVSDGPFVESKEYVAGFDLIEAADLDEAIAIAAAHPLAHFHTVEVRPFMEMPVDPQEFPYFEKTAELPPAARLDSVPAGKRRHVLFMCANGIAEPDDEEAQVLIDAHAWAKEVCDRGVQIFGSPLAHPDTATTVRVRDGETLLSDGPFTEAKEFIAGLDIIDTDTEQEAIELAARHPLARYHLVEVRPFATDMTG
jgi:hypothetical protein